MKQVLNNLNSGEILVAEVPRPLVNPGTVLVKNHFSLISAGTESGTVKLGQMSYLGKARARPEQVKKVINVIRTEGLLTAYNAAKRTLEMPIPLGYSCAGEIVEVGDGIDQFDIGDFVACAGAFKAVHAEYVVIPKNLCVKIPDGVDKKQAAFTTIGSVALQGLRTTEPQLGEHIVVIGLGLVGLLTVELLKASGCNVFGIDIDPARVNFANENGYCPASTRGSGNIPEQILTFSKGYGADKVIITAAAPTNDPIILAGEITRQKGRVVVVGRTGMNAPRDTYLFKELELCTSYGYGAGVDDQEYEEKGRDYPIGYARWTLNRNMTAFLDQINLNRINLETLITHEYALEDAPEAYGLISGQSADLSIGIILKYPKEEGVEPKRYPSISRLHGLSGDTKAPVRVGIIGAGGFATNFLIPALKSFTDISLGGIASATGVRAKALAEKYSFIYCTGDPSEIFNDPEIDCLFVLTRHDTHAEFAIKAMEGGKHVYVEKPLAMSEKELKEVIRTQKKTGRILSVGFNRPFSALSVKLADFFAKRKQPLSISWRASVGYRPPDHWLHDPVQGGGVILGEVCHFIDYCLWLTGAEPVEAHAVSLSGNKTGIINEDNVHIELLFNDGSLASINYLSCGDPSAGRERLEVMSEGGTAELNDFQRLFLTRKGKTTKHRIRLIPDKGYRGEIQAFFDSIHGRYPWETALYRYYCSSLATLKTVEALKSGTMARIDTSAIPNE